MIPAPVETGDMMVVTCRVPGTELSELGLEIDGHRVEITAPDGFRHAVELPADADMDRLGVELFHGFLELRAPRLSPNA